jgi:hypothetical protein
MILFYAVLGSTALLTTFPGLAAFSGSRKPALRARTRSGDKNIQII